MKVDATSAATHPHANLSSLACDLTLRVKQHHALIQDFPAVSQVSWPVGYPLDRERHSFGCVGIPRQIPDTTTSPILDYALLPVREGREPQIPQLQAAQ
jgi:hypothetical protein